MCQSQAQEGIYQDLVTGTGEVFMYENCISETNFLYGWERISQLYQNNVWENYIMKTGLCSASSGLLSRFELADDWANTA